MDYGFDTLQLHAGQKPDGQTHARAMPIYQTTSYCSAKPPATLFGMVAEIVCGVKPGAGFLLFFPALSYTRARAAQDTGMRRPPVER